MAYAFVQDVAASWERYELETAVAIYPAPEGLILHLAGPGLLVYPKAERDVLVTFQVGRARCTIVTVDLSEPVSPGYKRSKRSWRNLS
jgi:hypothetical protein